MLRNTFPVYTDSFSDDTEFFLTLDGRLGVIAEVDSYLELNTKFWEITKAFPQLQIQALSYQSKYYLSVSEYLKTPMDSILSTATIPRDVDLSTEAEEIATRLFETTQGLTRLCKYPVEFDSECRHLYKLKYHVNEQSSLKLGSIDGVCLIHFPSIENATVMFYANETLKDLLLSRILCIEFVEEFKQSAYIFWLPLGASQYFATLFKL